MDALRLEQGYVIGPELVPAEGSEDGKEIGDGSGISRGTGIAGMPHDSEDAILR